MYAGEKKESYLNQFTELRGKAERCNNVSKLRGYKDEAEALKIPDPGNPPAAGRLSGKTPGDAGRVLSSAAAACRSPQGAVPCQQRHRGRGRPDAGLPTIQPESAAGL